MNKELVTLACYPREQWVGLQIVHLMSRYTIRAQCEEAVLVQLNKHDKFYALTVESILDRKVVSDDSP